MYYNSLLSEEESVSQWIGGSEAESVSQSVRQSVSKPVSQHGLARLEKVLRSTPPALALALAPAAAVGLPLHVLGRIALLL